MPTTTPFANLITFSRGSNATVVGPNGLVQWAPSNLLLNSEQFDNANWTKGNGTVAANTTVAPDGTTTADRFTATAGTAATFVQQAFTSIAAAYTASFYVRASSGVQFVQLLWSSGQSTNHANFDIVNGTVGTSTATSATITAVGSSWYRITITSTLAAAAGAVNVYCVPASTSARAASFTATGSEAVLLWGAQLELGTAATTYNPTTVKNLLGFSEAFDNAAWTKGGASIVTGAQANPVNGLFNAQKLMEDTSTGDHRTFQAVSVTNGTPYVFSAYVKPAGRTLVNLTSVSGALMNVTFDVSTGVITSTTNGVGSIVAVGSGWYRIAVTATATSTASANFQIRLLNNVPALSYTGDGNSGIYIYGAQLSDSASLDPYVPTPGAAPSSTAYYGPRFDYNPATLQPRGILIEEQRTNLFTNSEFPNGLSDAPTRGGNVSATTFSLLFGNTGLAINNTGPVTSFAYKTNFTTVVSTTYTLSAFVRMNDGNAPSFVSAVTTDSANSFALVIAGSAVIPTTYTVTAMGNGFYRVSATATAGSASVNNGIVKYDTNDSRPFTVSGYQLEAGAFATSYIPTIASTVTRSADVATITGQNFGQWYGQTAGSFVVEFQTLQSGALSQTIYALALDTSGSKRIVYIANGGDVASTFDGTTIISASDRDVTGTVSKTASAYDGSGRAIVSNGGAVATGAVVAGYSTASTLNIGQLGGGQSFGWLRSIRYIPVRAADFQLQALTT